MKTLEIDSIMEQSTDSLHVLNAISPASVGLLAFAERIVDRTEGGMH
jgi:hypothetical protein